MSDSTEAADKNVEIWKVKKLIKSLEAARGNGTSMISLIIPPGQLSFITSYESNFDTNLTFGFFKAAWRIWYFKIGHDCCFAVMLI